MPNGIYDIWGILGGWVEKIGFVMGVGGMGEGGYAKSQYL